MYVTTTLNCLSCINLTSTTFTRVPIVSNLLLNNDFMYFWCGEQHLQRTGHTMCAHLDELPRGWSKYIDIHTGWSIRNQTKALTALSVWCPCRGSWGFIPQINTVLVQSASNPALRRIPRTDDLCLAFRHPNVPRAWNSYRKLVGCVYLIRKQRLEFGFEHVESEGYVDVAAGAKIIFADPFYFRNSGCSHIFCRKINLIQIITQNVNFFF